MRIVLFLLLLTVNSAYATRIKDIAAVEGVRENLLIGYGLVVGLNGTGDNLKNAVFTQKGLTDLLERLGINIHGANLNTKNIAAVVVTADLPAFGRSGTRMDVKVSALGDAKSLRNGTLIATPLVASDGEVYGVAQGNIMIPDFEPVSDAVKTKPSSISETNGYIQHGAIIENEVGFDFKELKHIKLSLYNPDFNTSVMITEAINNNIPGNVAIALDPATVQVTIPNYKHDDIVAFIASIESLTVTPDYKAKVVIDEATATVVIGDNVMIRPVAISQGNLVVKVAGDQEINGSMPLNLQYQNERAIDEKRGSQFYQLHANANLSDLVAGLNQLGVWPRDIINVLLSMRSVGALDAVIEVK